MKKVFIDGSAGTTGLRIRERLSSRSDIEVVVLGEEKRKDIESRREAINSADVAILCLPDDAALVAADLVENDSTVIIDTSTAHRVAEGWDYGFPELEARREKIRISKRIANPGCHASGFIALVEPLVRNAIVDANAPLCAFSLTGYSGGGKKMIAEYGSELANIGDGILNSSGGQNLFLAGRQYALGQAHKHLPEMVKICALAKAPVFAPIIVPHFSGMETSVMIHGEFVKGGIEAVKKLYGEYYRENGMVRFVDSDRLGAVLSSAIVSGCDEMLLTVHGNDERIVLTALFDNLGKGASGAAIQNMNLAIGAPEDEGLKKFDGSF